MDTWYMKRTISKTVCTVVQEEVPFVNAGGVPVDTFRFLIRKTSPYERNKNFGEYYFEARTTDGGHSTHVHLEREHVEAIRDACNAVLAETTPGKPW